MTDMVERVAIGIAEADGWGWREVVPNEREVYMDRARKAIEAMLEPTMEMTRAGVAADEGVTPALVCDAIYVAYIDAALRGESDEG